MRAEEFKMLTPEKACIISAGECWPIEKMEEHGAVDDNPMYIGSKIGELSQDGSASVTDFYKDKQGRFWYKSRKRLHDGRIVSMETYLFPNYDPQKYKRKRPR